MGCVLSLGGVARVFTAEELRSARGAANALLKGEP